MVSGTQKAEKRRVIAIDIGATLKSARELKKISLSEVAEATKIRKKYLEAMEEESFSLLPGDTYTRAFIRTYARYLDLDAEELVAQYREKSRYYHPQDLEDADLPAIEETKTKNYHRGKGNRLFRFLIIIIVLGVAGGILSNKFDSRHPVPKESSTAVTSTKSPPAKQNVQISSQTSQGLDMQLRVTSDQCWVLVIADGNNQFEGILQAGQEKSFQAAKNIYIKLGNAGVVDVELNGQDLGCLGGVNQVVKRTFTAPSA